MEIQNRLKKKKNGMKRRGKTSIKKRNKNVKGK